MSTAAASSTTDPLGSEWVRERPGARELRGDLIMAGVLVLATALSILLASAIAQSDSHAPTWLCIVYCFWLAGPLAVRRRYPEIVTVVVALAFYFGQELLVPEYLFSNICLFVAIYTVGAWGRRRRLSIAVRVVVIALMFLWLLLALLRVSGSPTAASTEAGALMISPYVATAVQSIIINGLYFGGAYYFGEVARQSARRREALEERTSELARERERSSAQAVTLERVRIARELHDVVAHHVSVMGVQAGAARRVLARDPEKAATSLGSIEQNARAAVDELHRMLTALRSDDATAPIAVAGRSGGASATAPGAGAGARSDAATSAASAASTRGVAQLPELVDEVARIGLPVRLLVVGEPRQIPATIGFTVYRLAQESLTNVRKHAGANASADVRLRYLENEVEIEISDTGVGSRGAAQRANADTGARRSGGLGQLGMRERVAAVGGTIEMASKARGGYLVRARLPAVADCPEAAVPADAPASSPADQTDRIESTTSRGAP